MCKIVTTLYGEISSTHLISMELKIKINGMIESVCVCDKYK